MASHISNPREAPDGWRCACLPQVFWSSWGDGIGWAARLCLLTPMGTLLAPREFPAALILREQFSPLLCYFFSPCEFNISFDKSILDVFSKLKNWRGLPAENDSKQVVRYMMICLFNYDVWCTNYSSPPKFHTRMTLAVLFHLTQVLARISVLTLSLGLFPLSFNEHS